MIVKMKKISLLCLESDRTIAMEQLRDLGIMHVSLESRVESSDVLSLEHSLEEVAQVGNILSGYKSDKKSKDISGKEVSFSGKEIFEQGAAKLERKSVLEKELLTLQRSIEQLAPWGNFSYDTLAKLKQNSVHVLFCMAQRSVYESLETEEGSVKCLISTSKDDCYFLLISLTEPDPGSYPVVKLPEQSLSDLQNQSQKMESELTQLEKDLVDLAMDLEPLKAYHMELEAEHEFAMNRDGMESDGAIACIHGYVPAESVAVLTEAARKNGWAVAADDPEILDEKVPTYLKHPKWLKVIEPLFDFIGIAPGYRENDVALFFLLAFPIFFGMLIGDSGYGALFIVTALLCKYLTREKPQAQLPLNLLLLLSCFSVIWGLLTGSCFGLSRSVLPSFLAGLDFLAAPAESPAACALAKKLHIADPGELTNKFVQWFCFLLAGLHLSSARLYKCFTDLRNWRTWGHLGWVCVIWANFLMAVDLIVFPGTFPKVIGFSLYILGLILIVGTTTAEAALNLPSALVGSFVDVLSYIRLFAVGLSGVYVGSCFNDMGLMLMNALPKYLTIVGVIGLILVAMTGHILNILLGVMGVLVHAIRLNTLEFSNHIEMQWTGIAYRPFAKKKK